MHPIKKVCLERRLTYDQFAALVNHKAGKEVLKGEYVATLVCGARLPSPALAAVIERAFTEVRKEDLVWPKDKDIA